MRMARASCSLPIRICPHRLESVPASLPESARKKLAAALRERVLPRFAREVADASTASARALQAQTAAAKKLGLSQSTISRLVLHEQGGSLDAIEKVARFLNEEVASFFSDSSPSTGLLALREMHGYEEALHEARKRIAEEGREVSEEALHAAGDMRLAPPLRRVTAQFLVAVAVEYSRAPEDVPPPKKKHRKK